LLDEKKAKFEASATEEQKKIYAAGINDIIEKGTLKKAKKVGEEAPDFALTDATGKTISLKKLLAQGPVVLTWYRGGWCPYCNITLNRMKTEMPKFKEAGASFVVLTPELPDKSLTTKEKIGLEFTVLSDVGNEVAKTYGIVFRLTEAVAESYQNSFDLHTYNGDETNELPLAATYVIDPKGIIRYAFVRADYRERAEPADILEALRKLK
jgi:peroxiredoxin